MIKKTYALIILLLAISLSQTIQAKIELPDIVSSNMVLQRNTNINLWGWSKPNEEITIKTSWFSETISVKANKNGEWQVEVKTTNSKSQQTIQLKSKESEIVLDNILFGEVWLCSGQSNMQQPIRGYTAQPTFDSTQAIAKSRNPNLRLFSIAKDGAKTPQKNIKKYIGWEEASPNSVYNFSAIGYFYAQQLQEILDVPVGIIHSSFGGSKVKAWLSKEGISNFEDVNLNDADIKNARYIPTTIFNAMINPLIPYTIKGVLWYQGESDRHEPELYKKLFPAMVKDWRRLWNQGDFPFYYVQIAPHSYERDKKKVNTAFMREAQLQCLDIIPNSGMAITLDVGDENSIHPPKKKPIADRLLYLTLNKTYAYKRIDGDAPIYDTMEIKNKGIVLSFKYAKEGLYTFDILNNFEIAGDDRVFYPAKAKIINKNKVVVEHEKVPNPVAVRYAWCNWVEPTLYDNGLLPASSFRTDNWDDATQAVNN